MRNNPNTSECRAAGNSTILKEYSIRSILSNDESSVKSAGYAQVTLQTFVRSFDAILKNLSIAW